MSGFITIDPTRISQQDNYKLLIGSILPRPIAFVSTQSPEGILNLAPFSFFNGVCSNPPTVLFCPTVRGSDGQKKDTLRNIEATREFVVNIVSEDIVRPMNETAAEVPFEVNEFELAGLTPAHSVVVKPPRVMESPVSLECQLQQVIYVGDGSIGSGSVVLGTVVQFHIREDLYRDGRIDTALLKPVARLAGSAYCPVRESFELQRPKAQS
ncbi:MAG TPA: flavin reductase family protein [Oculatellaceae cyanobacterium]|jgi:flavin reductase (DIM6/NTAB) family NADH-FMN oxidoreductase RutF